MRSWIIGQSLAPSAVEFIADAMCATTRIRVHWSPGGGEPVRATIGYPLALEPILEPMTVVLGVHPVALLARRTLVPLDAIVAMWCIESAVVH